MLPNSFKNPISPIFDDVQITDIMAYYDCPLFGMCKINDKELFFMDIIYDTWRKYEDGTHQRLWAIYAVYDITKEQAEEYISLDKERRLWQGNIEGNHDPIGIFWQYTKAEGAGY